MDFAESWFKKKTKQTTKQWDSSEHNNLPLEGSMET